MTDPQRLQPGTRMPTVFFSGKSTYTHILEGLPDRQRLALWQYLLVCRNLPYPEGLHPPQKLRFPDTKGVQAVRTFLPGNECPGDRHPQPRRPAPGLRRAELPARLCLVGRIPRHAPGMGRTRRESGGD